jgi:hypothetical protein
MPNPALRAKQDSYVPQGADKYILTLTAVLPRMQTAVRLFRVWIAAIYIYKCSIRTYEISIQLMRFIMAHRALAGYGCRPNSGGAYFLINPAASRATDSTRRTSEARGLQI